MADTPKLVSSMGRAELDRIFVRNYDLNKDLLGKITFAQMVYLMIVGRMPTAEEGRMVDTMLIVLVDHGMTTGAAAARMTFHSAPEAIQGAVAAAILGAGSVHLGSSEHCRPSRKTSIDCSGANSESSTTVLLPASVSSSALFPLGVPPRKMQFLNVMLLPVTFM